ncbi:MAG: LapA family protein [Desulfatibacillum sp.]|nr:LapA family protein [Desulfatibacillum sp.]
MNYFKAGLVGVLGAVCIMVLFQNAEFLKAPYSLGVDFKLSDAWVYHTPELPNGLFLLIAAFIGLLVGYGITIPGWLRNKKALRKNNDQIKALLSQVTELKNRPAPKFTLDSEEEAGRIEEATSSENMLEDKDARETVTQ